ncbi:colon cancer-associated protein Mic1-like-domain-containing protein [Polychytrium aggregatum]|uniref:colon cancer-associated protein Mic1-like-domain-containing protein n=1 Tax=Polychytrium aggregatum TaxID=110093 RepID=UPI0022FF3811|nr:colon cancer-associated protein Mic1-like-domain-containing protein [Polychytrium aggregatum]KAI9204665.1 colon cancer-associated protein Mic1-like-domain-containing protein [Polychytrium aggregatum]
MSDPGAAFADGVSLARTHISFTPAYPSDASPLLVYWDCVVPDPEGSSPYLSSEQQPRSTSYIAIASASDSHIQCVLLKSPEVEATFQIGTKGSIRRLALSPDGSFLGTVRSAKQLEVFTTHSTTPVFTTTRDTKPSDVILGVEWTEKNTFVCVTNENLDFYQYSDGRSTFVQKRSYTISSNWYQYSPEHRLLAVSTGPRTLTLYRVGSDSTLKALPILRLDNLKIDPATNAVVALANGQSTHRTQVLGSNLNVVGRRNVSFVTLYGTVYCVYLDTTPGAATPGSPPPCNLFLYEITKTACRLAYSFVAEHSRWPNIAAVNDILVVASMDRQSAHMFDLKLGDPAGFRTNVWIETDSGEHSPSELRHQSDWQIDSSNRLLSPSRGCVYELRLNVEAMALHYDAKAVAQTKRRLQTETLNFLIRRRTEEALLVCLSLIRGYIENGVEPSALRTIFDTYTKMGSKAKLGYDAALRPSDSTDSTDSIHSMASSRQTKAFPKAKLVGNTIGKGYFAKTDASGDPSPVLSQEQLYTHVFGILANDKSVPTPYLTHVLLEYVTSLTTYGQPVEPYIYELWASLLCRSDLDHELVEQIRLGVIEPSPALGRLLLLRGGRLNGAGPLSQREQCQQLGLDMLTRLGRYDEVVEHLLGLGQIHEAVAFAQDHGALPEVPSVRYLEAAHESKDKTLFLNVYQLLERNGMLQPTQNQGVGRFVSIYREMWDDVVLMVEVGTEGL